MTKTDFDNKLTSYNRQITSNKTKYLEVQKKVDSLVTNDYNFFVDRIYFTSNDGFQNMFVYEPTHDTLELKKDKCMLLNGNQMEYIILNFSHYILLSYIA